MSWHREQRRLRAVAVKQQANRNAEMREVIAHNWRKRSNPFCRDLIRYAIGYLRG